MGCIEINIKELNALLKKVTSKPVIDDVMYHVLMGTAKRLPSMKADDVPENIRKNALLYSQVILYGYVVFVYIKEKNDLKTTINAANKQLDTYSGNSKVISQLEKIVRYNKKNEPLNLPLMELYTLFRNSLSHGTFKFLGEGNMEFKDMKRKIIVESYEFVELCKLLEKLLVKNNS